MDSTMNQPTRILVLCTGNRCRSQMAEGWLRHFGGDAVEVQSAGTKPKGLHPTAVRVMAEAGVDIAGHSSKHVGAFANDAFDYVVTVCDSAKEACPVFPNAKRTIHHSFDDPDRPDLPEPQRDALFRRVRDQVRDWARAFVEETVSSASR
jgi:arsenate reductase (thioredoxin)